MLTYLIHVGDALSQLVNTVILFGEPNESISGRAYRLNHVRPWGYVETGINWLFSPFEKDHCKKAYDADYERAEQLVRGF